MIATRPTSFITRGFNPRPTIKRRIETPICEKASNVDEHPRKFNKAGPTRMPVMI